MTHYTREAGLQQICRIGGHIYRATSRLRWPGDAAVVVSVVFVAKGSPSGHAILDGRRVPGLNSFLFPSNVDFDPVPLAPNADSAFQGACVLGMGFTFDDTDTTGAASSIGEMAELIQRSPENSERIFPYIGGQEINWSPVNAHHRYVIDFGDMSLEEASRWPELLDIVRRKVKPERDKIGGYSVAERRQEYWWQFGTTIPALNRAKAGLRRVLAIARISNAFALVFLSAEVVCNEKTIVFPFESDALFATLQCRVHETWARFFGSTLKDDFQYTPSDCFENFPLPEAFESVSSLEETGKRYYDFRADLMIRSDEGLTKTYNRFHDPNDDSADIQRLRELHAAMDRAVLDAYGWQDILPACAFCPEFDEEDEDDESGRPKRKKYRYRWPEHIHDEVLGRLLDLNRQRALEEGQILVPEQTAESPWSNEGQKPTKKGSRKSEGKDSPGSLFGTPEKEV